MNRFVLGLLLLPFLGVLGISFIACDSKPSERKERDDDDEVAKPGSTFDASEVFQPCIETELKSRAKEYAMQLIFEPCGSNRFLDFSWAPDGLQLYYELPGRAMILNADTSRISTIEDNVPHGPGAWLHEDLLLVPISAESTVPKSTKPPTQSRIGVFNQLAELQATHTIDIGLPRDLQPWNDGARILLTGISPEDGLRYPYIFDPQGGHLNRVLQELGPVENLSWAGPEGLIAYFNGKETVVQRASGVQAVSDWQVLARYKDVRRGIVHPSSRYVALETLGPSTSMYFQQPIEVELSDSDRKREEARREQFIAQLPEGTLTEVQPPEIHFLDVKNGQRYRITAFKGDHFQWYEFQDYWASFILWGFENEQVQTNVVALDMSTWLQADEATQAERGMEQVKE